MRKYVDVPDKALSITYNASSVIIQPMKQEWVMEQLNNCEFTHDYLLQPDSSAVFVMESKGGMDITAKLHICDAIENILKEHAGFKGIMSLNFSEVFMRVVDYKECIAIYGNDTYSVCYHLKYDDGISGESLDKYFKNLYKSKFKSRGK